MFKNSTNYTLSPENLFHIAMGILIMINTILDIDMESFDKLIKYASKDAISKDWADNFKQYAQTIKSEYFVYMMDFFKKVKDDNDQIFAWIEEITFGIYQSKPQEEIIKILKRHKKFRYDYEDLKKKKEDEENSNITKSKSRKNKKSEDEKTEKTEKTDKSQEDGENSKAKILERDGFGPVGPQHKGKKNIRDFFNFNKDDNLVFKNDVHNGVYEIAEITGDMVMGMKDRVYNEIYEKPPVPTDVDEDGNKKKKNGNEEEDQPQKIFKPSGEDYNPDHQIYSMDQLKNKIQKEELYGMLQKKKNYNKEEGDYLQKKIDQVDPGFEKRIAQQLEEEAEKDKRLKENNNDEMAGQGFNNIQPKGRKTNNTEESNSLSKNKSKSSKINNTGSDNAQNTEGSKAKNTEESKVKNTEESKVKNTEESKAKNTEESKIKNTVESKKSKQSKKSMQSKKSKKSSKKEEESDEDEEEEEEEDDDDEDNEEEDEAKNENTYSGSNDGSEESKE
jgi:hypothetical protein